MPEIVKQMTEVFRNPKSAEEVDVKKRENEDQEGLTFKELIGAWRGLSIGTILGIFLGALPGPGATLSSYTAYSVTAQATKDKNYGKGSLEGVAAAESANNATCGATFYSNADFWNSWKFYCCSINGGFDYGRNTCWP